MNFRSFVLFGFVIATGVITFLTTRGSDGNPLGMIYGFALIAISYCSYLYQFPIRRYAFLLIDLVLLEIAVAIALIIHPTLEEMGGMLNLFAPCLPLGVVFLGFLTSILMQRK